ncbi:MAG: GNAT family N-acetyltransferase [Coriobacteriia bacterium]|nr:GNAT family N-acetyltransferase [Coriobacteriia bacterium]
MKCKPVRTPEEISTLAQVADEIWHEYWPGLIGDAQTDYMVEQFQSESALAHAINEDGYLYYLLFEGDRIVGYMGAQPQEDEKRLFLSKLYVYEAERGNGYAAEALKLLELICKESWLKTIYLTVNKGNDLAIDVYKAKGFDIVDSVEKDIGDGFVMDDYIMEKKIALSCCL